MKILFLFLFLPLTSFAYSGGDAAISAAIAAGAATSIVAGTQHAFYLSLMNEELKGWRNEQTGTTATLESQCGGVAEFHLVGNHGTNFLIIGLTNPTDSSLVVKYSEVEFIYNETGHRFPGWTTQPSDYDVQPSWWFLNFIPFPSKEEFKDYEKLEVKIPIYKTNTKETCTISATFNKKENLLKEQISYSIVEMSFEGGPSLSQHGAIENLGKPESLFGLSMNFFFHPNHAAGFTILNENEFEGSDNSRIYSKFEKGSNYTAYTSILGFNYAYRHFLTPTLSFNYEPGIGYQRIEERSNSKDSKALSTAMAFTQKLLLNWRIATVTGNPLHVMSIFVSVGPVYVWVPSDELNGQNLDGHRLGLLFRFGMGM